MIKAPVVIGLLILVCFSAASYVFGRKFQQGYILEHEKDIAKNQPSPHAGAGMSTGYSFFTQAPGLKVTFRKRVLKKGSSIGYHLQNDDEIYYIVSGTGIMKMNEESFVVEAGDGILTRPGNSHGLQQTGRDDLVVIINYLVH